MARSTTPAGIGYKDKHDLNDKVFTPADSEFVAVTVDSAVRGVHTELDRVKELAEAVLAMSGIGPTSPVDAQTAALINQAETLTRKAVNAVVETAKVSAFGVRVDAYGVVGDGAKDDTDAFHAAASAAATFGVPLVIPAGMSIGISSYKRLPEGLTMHTNGSSFQQITPMGRAPVVGLGPRSTVVGGLRVQTLGGDACQGVHVADAPDVTVYGGIEVRSSTPGAGKANIRDNGVRVINSPRFTADRVYVENYDWAFWADQSPNLRIGWLEVSTYSLAIRFRDCSQLRILGGRAHTAGPNSAYLPGYNGILMESDIAQEDVRIDNFTVENAGEHGYRVSGAVAQNNIWFNNCLARNVGGSGFKVLGGPEGTSTVYNRDITFNGCSAIDAGVFNQNTCGFLIQRGEGIRLINPVVRRAKQQFSATEGIRMSSCRHVTVSGARILDSQKYAVRLDEAFGQGMIDVTFSDLDIQVYTGNAIYLQNPGVMFKDIRIDGHVENVSADGSGFYAGKGVAAEDSGTWSGMNVLRVVFSDSTGAPRQVSSYCSERALASFMADITMWRAADAAPSWPPFSGGSMILDRRLSSRQVMKGGVWAGL